MNSLLFRVKKPRKLFDHRAAHLFGIHDGHWLLVATGYVMAETDLGKAPTSGLANHLAFMLHDEVHALGG